MAGFFDEAVAVGDDALFAVEVLQVEEALSFAGGEQRVEVRLHEAMAAGAHEVAQRVADDFFDGAAGALRAVLVDGKNRAVEGVRADEAE